MINLVDVKRAVIGKVDSAEAEFENGCVTIRDAAGVFYGGTFGAVDTDLAWLSAYKEIYGEDYDG